MIEWVKVSERLPDEDITVLLNKKEILVLGQLTNFSGNLKWMLLNSLLPAMTVNSFDFWIEKEKLLPKPELRPCPFCGEKERIDLISNYFGIIDKYCVHCMNCGSRVSSLTSKKDSIKSWNRRCDDGN